MEGRLEDSVDTTFRDTSDGCLERQVVVTQILGGITQSITSLIGVGIFAYPHEDVVASIADEGIAGVKHALVEGTLSNLGELQRTRSIAQPVKDLTGTSEVSATFFSRLDGSLTAQQLPELIVTIGFIEDNNFRLTTPLVIERAAELAGLHSFHTSRVTTIPLVESHTKIKNKDVAAVKGVASKGNFVDADILEAASPDVIQTGFVFLLGDVSETAFNTALKDTNTLGEIRAEQFRLIALNFAVFYGFTLVEVVQLYGLVRGGTSLILACLSAEPEVDIELEVGRGAMSVEHNVRVTLIEFTIMLNGPRDDFEFLNSPNFEANGLASSVPLFFRLGGSFTAVVFNFSAEEFEVRTLDGVGCWLLHCKQVLLSLTWLCWTKKKEKKKLSSLC